MFYVKHETEEMMVKVEINDENVFTTCPTCGKEQQVDLYEVFKGEDVDLFGTSVWCGECSAKMMHR